MNEFDKWRRDYEALSFSDQVIYHNDLERRYPEQNHFNYELVKSALQLIENPVVVEFGTWLKTVFVEMILLFLLDLIS